MELPPETVRVGRGAPGCQPEVVLEPDPERWVGRLHCLLEYEAGTWWLSDSGTVNGTFVRRGTRTERVADRVRLRHFDAIRIAGGRSELAGTAGGGGSRRRCERGCGGRPPQTTQGELRYWELVLVDPHATRPIPVAAPAEAAEPLADSEPCLEYDWVQARLFGRHGERRYEIEGLSPLAHRLVRYMAGRSRANGWVPVACTHEELIQAVWGDGDQPAYASTLAASPPHEIAPQAPRFRGDPERQSSSQVCPTRAFVLRLGNAALRGTALSMRGLRRVGRSLNRRPLMKHALVSDLRKRLEPDRPRGAPSRLLETVPGIG